MAKAKLPALPEPRTSTPERLEQLPGQVAAALPAVNDLALLKEWTARADALAEYLRTHDLYRPLVGVQRRIEARVGQLLSPPGGPGGYPPDPQREYEAELFPHANDRRDFRWLAKALDGDVRIPNDDWWERPRGVLVRAIREELDALPERRDGNAKQRVRRRRRRRQPTERERGEWLVNAIANAGAAAELASDLADAETIRSLSNADQDKVLEGINLARVYLQRVATQTRRYGNEG